MKFKAQEKQNQLIENITANHIIVGVDIAQETHVARAVNFRGIALGNPLEFSNDEVGFRSLDRWIRGLLAAYKTMPNNRRHGANRTLLKSISESSRIP
jgi:transposase